MARSGPEGFLLNQPDPVTLEHELPVFDALYAYAREKVAHSPQAP